MTVRRIITAFAIVLLPLAAGAATLIVPAAGTGAGANGSQWQTELMLHSTSTVAIEATLVFHDSTGAMETAAIEIAPRATLCLDDVVKAKFRRDGATGAIEITYDDSFANKLSATSRTFNKSSNGQFGQDIPAVKLASAATEGVSIVINGPSEPAESRFNFGVFAAEPTTVKWELVRADGSVAGTVNADYEAGTHTQYNSGVASFFGLVPENDDVIIASIEKGSALAYGSIINEATGDPTYVPGYDTRPDIHAKFVGVDYDFNGSAEILDTDRDGMLDAAVDVYSGQQSSNAFQLIVADPDAKFELVSSSYPVTVSEDGLVVLAITMPSSGSGTIKVRVTVNGTSDILRIPIRFREPIS
jgi:hypothetical protein